MLMLSQEAERRQKIIWAVSGGASEPGKRNLLPAKGISTGSYGFDKALGIGGVPKGRIVEVYGPASCGKTTLALHVVADAQKSGGTAAFIDAEHALNLQYSRQLGVRVDELIVSKPDSGEMALDLALSLVETGLIELVVIDSVAALTPESELAAPFGEDHFSDLEQMLAKGLRKLERSAFRTGACVLFINQVRSRTYETSGNPETTTGGRPLRFYAAVRIELSSTEPVIESRCTIGSRVRMRVIKNKLAGGFRSAVAPLIHGEGFSRELELLDIACAHKVLEKNNRGFIYHGDTVTRLELKQNPVLVAVMMEEVRACARMMRAKPVGKAIESPVPIIQSA